MAKAKGRARDFEDPDEKGARDYDPEAIAPESDHGGDGDSSDGRAGTEHYVAVGASRLRHKEGVSLGPQYRGSRVSRRALERDGDEEEGEDSDDDDDDDDDDSDESDDDEADEYDDPETAHLSADEARANDSEIDSDDALAESDSERLNGFAFRGSSKPAKANEAAGKRPTAADFMSSDSENERGGAGIDEELSDGEASDSEDDQDVDDGLDALVDGGGDSEDDHDMDDGLDALVDGGGDSKESDQDSEAEAGGSDEFDGDEEPAEAKAADANPHMAAFSMRPEVEKGTAIQKQRTGYDGLLKLRIRLQKALVAANTLPTLDPVSDDEAEAYEAAEEAAMKLLNTMSSLRGNFGASTGDKRKRELDTSMDSEAVWRRLQEEDEAAVQQREDCLSKWWRRVQSVSVTGPGGLGQKNKSLVSSLAEQLADPQGRLLKRTRVPRSCAPAQAAKKTGEDEGVYDDADFYQLLLKELVDQRTVETWTAQASAVPNVVVTAAKEAKVRKQVDRKASKGRKMRFTVHDKLQNFMAPEDLTSWEREAVDRFFGTLFGRRMELDEEESGDDEALDAEEEGLVLFRNGGELGAGGGR